MNGSQRRTSARHLSAARSLHHQNALMSEQHGGGTKEGRPKKGPILVIPRTYQENKLIPLRVGGLC